MLEPYAAHFVDLGRAQPPQVNAGDLGAERAGNALHVHPSHAPLVRKCSCSARASSAWGLTPSLRQRCAALPAAWPITKHGPETRAADWPPCVIEAQRPATSRFSAPCGRSIRYGSWLYPRGLRWKRNSTLPATCSSTGQPLTPIASGKSAHSSTSSSES